MQLFLFEKCIYASSRKTIPLNDSKRLIIFSIEIEFPVGLFGLQRNIILVFLLISFKIEVKSRE